MEHQPSAPANPASTAQAQAQPPPPPQPQPQPSYHRQQSPIADTYHHREHEDSEKDEQYVPRGQRGSKGSSRSRAHDSVMSNPLSPRPIHLPPSPSISTPEIQRSMPTNNEPAYPPRAYLDPEKVAGAAGSPRVSASNPDVTAVLYDSGEYHEKGPEDKPVQLLLFLSGPCALLSLFIALWTFVALLISTLLQPFRLLSSRSTNTAQLTTFLAPPLNLQLHLIYSYATSTEYSAPMLVVIHLISPFVAVGVAIAAWTAACFWFFSAILGDPAGQDSHNDGKDSILGVRNWWERWLSRALR
ncbi:hypothetical protein CC80DRAFT_498242 [Byssothecium circinans]|uniref:Uncharacterized protein n=1 Tax=Byssothecium circinans TaxID=147558 RepID=A0A6A5TCB5_9PLEO|nr:hypothetical protein CC80DRAFT_498242 [Byssothecium circinans]